MRLIGCNVLVLAALLIPIELGLRFLVLEPALAAPITFNRMDLAVRQLSLDPDLLWVPTGYDDRVATARGQHPSMVFMGDSCTYLGRYDEALESIFEARNPESDLTFVNVGVVGWSSWSGLRQLQRDVLSMRPKAISIFYGWNDHWKSDLGIEDKDAARFFVEEPPALRMIQLADKALFAFRRLVADTGRPRVSLTDFRANLRRMVRIARDHGVVPILLTAPTMHAAGREQADLPPWYAELTDLADSADVAAVHERYVQAVREVAAAEDALMVDLYQEFNRLSEEDVEPLFTRRDGIHPTPEGNRKIAELLDRHFAAADLYPRIVGGTHAEHAEAEERFEEALGAARLLTRGRFDVWLDDGRLVYVKDRCVASREERFFLHVWPVDPDDLPEHRKEHGFDNLDFDFWDRRLGFTRRCAAALRLPYPVARIRTGQFVEGDGRLWESGWPAADETGVP